MVLSPALIPVPPFPPLPGIPAAESPPLPPFPPVTVPLTVGVSLPLPSIPAPPFPPSLPSVPSAPSPPVTFALLPMTIPASAVSPLAPIPAAPSGCLAEPSPPLIVPFTISRFVPGCSLLLASLTNSSPGFASLLSSALSPVMVLSFKSILTSPHVSGISTVWSMSFFTMTL